jgi:hypothetical protein
MRVLAQERTKLSSARNWVEVLIPVVIVAAVLSAAIGARLAAYNGNLTGFVQFGSQFAGETRPPADALISTPGGYDGQFFYLQARDPLLLDDSTVAGLKRAGAAFRMQRAAYPALAFLAAGGDASALPATLLAVNVLIVLGLTGWFAAYCRRRGRSTLWALALGLTPGILLATLRDLSDPLAMASVLAGMLLWEQRRRAPAAALLTVAVLSRETMIVAVVAIAIDAALRAWSRRDQPGSLREIASEAWPVVLVPAAAFVGWQIYIGLLHGGQVGGANVEIPLTNFVQEIHFSFANGTPTYGIWDLLYLLLILAAVLGAFASLRRRVTVTGLAASLMALTVLVPEFGDVWSDTRVSAPLFALLLAVGLELRDRRLSAIPAAAAWMTILIPLAIPGAF